MRYLFNLLIFTSLVAGELKCVTITTLMGNQKRSDFSGNAEDPQTDYPGFFLQARESGSRHPPLRRTIIPSYPARLYNFGIVRVEAKPPLFSNEMVP